ncbi:serine/threonine-protein kinase [Nonomuraea soli]|uniref:non-specific serine/threonine protein kinase n=1 Tax=Nonomuraea soli TaxID=1032476 RepID=A0A7W0HNU1_9ACTN|nr:serine/threonine-protein kinase [Nonomuraea soli]MBA2890092.1 hypothetical protein [Nonomuraea soli]
MSDSERFQGWLLAGRYRLQAELGRGGMGRVWRGHDELLDRPVAVKEVTLDRRPQPEREELLGRTMREARLAARLSHPHIAAVYDVVVVDERPWIVLQLVSAPTLADVLTGQGPLPPATVARIGLQVLQALQAAHAAGIVHRDVKPANILLDADEYVMLTDFGLAASAEPAGHLDEGLTREGLVVGTPAYIAPERARGQVPAPPSDLWSLGVTLYRAVEGRCPFGQGSVIATLSAVLTAAPAPFNLAGPLAPLIAGLLAKDPCERTSVEDALTQLQRLSAPSLEQMPVTGAMALAPVASASPMEEAAEGSSQSKASRHLTPAPALDAAPMVSPVGPGTAADLEPATDPIAEPATRPEKRRRGTMDVRFAAAVAALVVAVLATTFWHSQRLGPAVVAQPMPTPMPASTAPPDDPAPLPSPAVLQPVLVPVNRSTPAATREQDPPQARTMVSIGKNGKVKQGSKEGWPAEGSGRPAKSNGKGQK